MRGWLPICLFVVITNHVSVREAAQNIFRFRFKVPRLKIVYPRGISTSLVKVLLPAIDNVYPSGKSTSLAKILLPTIDKNVKKNNDIKGIAMSLANMLLLNNNDIDKFSEDSIFFNLDNSVLNREPIAWAYYDEDTRERRGSNRMLHKARAKPQKTPLMGVVPPQCHDLPKEKAERCFASYRNKKLSLVKGKSKWGMSGGSGNWGQSKFAMGYYDDYMRLGNNRPEVFDDYDFDDYTVQYVPRSRFDDRIIRTRSNTLLTDPGDYGNYDDFSEDEDEPKSKSWSSQYNINEIKQLYTVITGDKAVNKNKILKFVKELNEKLRMYSKKHHTPDIRHDYTRTVQKIHS